MDTMNTQRGVTLIGWLIIISFFMMVGIGVMRLYPIYYDHMSVKMSLKKLAQDSSLKDASEKQIREILQRHFTVNNVESVTPEALEIIKKGGVMTLQMKYEARAPFIYNIDLIVRFDDSVVVN
ncbi:MAG: DUF4845 domain-containing protein [Gammaproteobacteria bacterium]